MDLDDGDLHDTGPDDLDLDAAADDLYAVDLDEFLARRAELAAQARQHGDRELAQQIAKLKKPVIAAWVVNAIVRSHPADIDRLSELATKLRDAHRSLKGKELRALSEARQKQLRGLEELASSVATGAGKTANDAMLRQTRATFEAAIADEDAESAVRSGWLTDALEYTGFGAVDASAAVAAPRSRARAARLSSGGAETPSVAERRRSDQGGGFASDATASKRRAELETVVVGAEQALLRATVEVRKAAEAVTEAEQRASEAESRLSQLTEALAMAKEEAASAKTELKAARRSQVQAGQLEQRASAALDEARGDIDAARAE
jgi:hypothetical protein